MLENYDTKDMPSPSRRSKEPIADDVPTKVKAISRLTQEYFFPGGGKYEPMTIVAATMEDAQKAYREKRQPIEKVENKSTDTK